MPSDYHASNYDRAGVVHEKPAEPDLIGVAPGLLLGLRQLGDSFGPMGVAVVAIRLAGGPKLVAEHTRARTPDDDKPMPEEPTRIAFAREELARLPVDVEDPDDQAVMLRSLIDAVVAFSSYRGHSEGSGTWAIHTLQRLLLQQPLTPLTGEPDEWTEVGTGVWQNRRCGAVFSEGADRPLNLDGATILAGAGSVTHKVPYRPGMELEQ